MGSFQQISPFIVVFFVDGSLPWHRVHAVSPEGPVGKNGVVQPGDHLVEVNNDYENIIILYSNT